MEEVAVRGQRGETSLRTKRGRWRMRTSSSPCAQGRSCDPAYSLDSHLHGLDFGGKVEPTALHLGHQGPTTRILFKNFFVKFVCLFHMDRAQVLSNSAIFGGEREHLTAVT